MAKAELAMLRRELDQTKEKLDDSLSLNLILQKRNHELVEEHEAGEAWEEEIKNAAADVRQIITAFRNGQRPTVPATVSKKARSLGVTSVERHRNAFPKPSVPLAVESRSASKVQAPVSQQSSEERQKCPYCSFSTLHPIIYSKHVASHEIKKKVSFGSNTYSSPSNALTTTGRERSPSVPLTMARAPSGHSSVDSSFQNPLKPTALALQSRTKFECDNCYKLFSFKSALEGHRRACGMPKKKLEKITVKPKPPSSAKSVAQSKSKLAARRRNVAKSHPDAIQCEYKGCDFVTKYPYNMKSHVSCVHENNRPFVCDWKGCSETFKYRAVLDTHVCRVHTGERPFECQNCFEGFFSSSERSHHYKNTECGQT